jgi:hypothetical protein
MAPVGPTVLFYVQLACLIELCLLIGGLCWSLRHLGPERQGVLRRSTEGLRYAVENVNVCGLCRIFFVEGTLNFIASGPTPHSRCAQLAHK